MSAPDQLDAERVASRFASLCGRLAGTVAAGIGKLYDAWRAGALTDDQFAGALADVVAAGVGAGELAGDKFAADMMTAWDRRATLPAGVSPATVPAVRNRMKAVMAELIRVAPDAEDGDTMITRLERIGRSESVNGAQQQVVRTYRHRGVNGYRRVTDADPCELCVWLVKAHMDPEGIGYIYPTDKPMHRHVGCQCVAVPATRRPRA